MAKNEEKKEPKITEITVNDHEKFEGDMKMNITSSVDLADVVSKLFGTVFSDYYGCKINVNDGHGIPAVAQSMPYGTLYVDLFFKVQDEDANKVRSLYPIGYNGKDKDVDKNDLSARFARVNGARTTGRAYTVSKETYEMLSKYMRNGMRTRWNEVTQEIETNMSLYGKGEIVVCISGLDLNKIITDIYGSETEEGNFEYIATPSTVIPGKNQEFIIQICQLDVKVVRNLQRTLGIYSANSPQFHKYDRRI